MAKEVESDIEEEVVVEDLELSDAYALWYHDVIDSSWTKDSYKNLCQGVGAGDVVRTGKQLWGVYHSFHSNITAGMFFLMRKDILPMWEDVANHKGGFWSFKVPKNSANEVWVTLTSAFVGNTLTKQADHMEQITGISVSPKISNCVMKIWVRSNKLKASDFTTEVKYLDNLMYRQHSS